MSTIYTLEPPTAGKVVLVTSLGEIEIELWSKEAPKACRNFVQLCLERYYDGTIFHRVIKDFMIQGGDPTGTGAGGESTFGEEFGDEVHSRLHFSHRGLVAMANSGKPNSNGSQFFITLEKSPWLDRKHTIFGRVTGTTIYNALKIGECEVVEGSDRPVEPPSIQKCEVVWNPFTDLVPRNLRPLAHEVVIGGVGEEEVRGGARKRKNLALLSFGDEAEEEEQELTAAPRARLKSIHDSVEDDARLVRAGTQAEALVRSQADEEWERERVARTVRAKLAGGRADAPPAGGDGDAVGDGDGDGDGEEGFDARLRRKVADKRRQLGDPAPPPPAPASLPVAVSDKEARRAARARDKEAVEAARREREADRLRRLGLTKAAEALQAEDAALYTAGEVKRREIKQRKARGGEREKATMERLAAFQMALAAPPAAPPPPPPADDAARPGAAGVSRFVSEGLYYALSDGEEEDPGAWRTHSLKFTTTAGSKSYAPSVDDYVVVDPLLEAGKAAFKTSKAGKRETEWAKKSSHHA